MGFRQTLLLNHAMEVWASLYVRFYLSVTERSTHSMLHGHVHSAKAMERSRTLYVAMAAYAPHPIVNFGSD